MNFMMPFQPIQPIAGNIAPPESAGLSPNQGSGNQAGMPFQNYLSQALNGVNDSIIHAGGLFQKVAAGQVKNLHQVTLASAEAEILLKLATGITSKITTDANTLFQMQF